MPLVRICAGGDQQWSSLPRPTKFPRCGCSRFAEDLARGNSKPVTTFAEPAISTTGWGMGNFRETSDSWVGPQADGYRETVYGEAREQAPAQRPRSRDTFGIQRDNKAHEKMVGRLRELQHLLYADKRYALLIVLQALDAGGKDGTIRHVMSGVNPQGCDVTSFKGPSNMELAHDYLWRVHQAVPQLGKIGIFNRSHYEDVLIVRVHRLAPEEIWSKRYRQINDFERMLTENGVTILKFFLHISKEEQRRRFEARMQDTSRNWKLSLPDFEERQHWNEYQEAYEDALRKCSTERAPWYVIPSDRKWLRNHIIAELIVRALDNMKLKYPAPTVDISKVVLS
jgi:PPK2 family polyphosphate:nucleotide phosphotransferase